MEYVECVRLPQALEGHVATKTPNAPAVDGGSAACSRGQVLHSTELHAF